MTPNDLLEVNLSLARRIAGRHIRIHRLRGDLIDEVHGAALRGLYRACRGYREGQGRFVAYAVRVIHCEIAQCKRELSFFGRLGAKMGAKCPLSGESVDAQHSHPPTLVEDRDSITEALAWLTSRQRRVILMRHLEQMTFWEIGRQLGVSHVMAARVYGRAVEGVRCRFPNAFPGVKTNRQAVRVARQRYLCQQSKAA